MIFNFVWSGKDKIKRLAFIGEYKDGGLKMPHPEFLIKTQRIACLARYLDDNSSLWKVFLCIYARCVGNYVSYGGYVMKHAAFRRVYHTYCFGSR